MAACEQSDINIQGILFILKKSLFLDERPFSFEKEKIAKYKGFHRGDSFYDSIERDDLKKVKKFLKSNPDYANITTNTGVSALMLAVKFGHTKMVRLLLKYGADVNHQSRDYLNTPLHIAVMNKRTKIGIILLENGANPSIKNKKQKNPYEYSS